MILSTITLLLIKIALQGLVTVKKQGCLPGEHVISGNLFFSFSLQLYLPLFQAKLKMHISGSPAQSFLSSDITRTYRHTDMCTLTHKIYRNNTIMNIAMYTV